jgi:hypothetical protein
MADEFIVVAQIPTKNQKRSPTPVLLSLKSMAAKGSLDGSPEIVVIS